jgi:hypothetical protein
MGNRASLFITAILASVAFASPSPKPSTDHDLGPTAHCLIASAQLTQQQTAQLRTLLARAWARQDIAAREHRVLTSKEKEAIRHDAYLGAARFLTTQQLGYYSILEDSLLFLNRPWNRTEAKPLAARGVLIDQLLGEAADAKLWQGCDPLGQP